MKAHAGLEDCSVSWTQAGRAELHGGRKAYSDRITQSGLFLHSVPCQHLRKGSRDLFTCPTGPNTLKPSVQGLHDNFRKLLIVGIGFAEAYRTGEIDLITVAISKKLEVDDR